MSEKPMLLIETIPFQFQLEEGKDGVSRLIARGQFARVDKATENKRFYRRDLYQREITKLQEAIDQRRVFGELDHPADGKTKLTRVSHVMTDLRIEGNEVVGAAELLDTPNGRILKAIYQAGAKPGVSSRGFGSTKSRADGIDEVQDDFNLHTFDFVADPATKTAYPALFNEELNKIPTDGDTSLTMETLERDFGGLVGEIRRQTATEQVDVATEELKTRFAEKLIMAVEQARDEAYQAALEELETDDDDDEAGEVQEQSDVRVISAQPLLGPSDNLGADPDDDRDAQIEELQAKLAEAEAELDKMAALAKRAGFQCHAEKCIGEMNLDRDKALVVLGDVTGYDELHEINDALFASWADLVQTEEETDSEENAENEAEIERLKESLEAAAVHAEEVATEVKAANRRALEAVEIAEGLQVQNYVERKVSGHQYASRIRRLCENSGSFSDVDRVFENFTAVRKPDDDEAERIRARVGRGCERNLQEELYGNANKRNGQGNHLSSLGVSIEEFEALSGRGPVS